MADLRTLVEQEMERAGTPTYSFRDLSDRRDRKRRNQRLVAAAVGLVFAALAIRVGTGFVRSSRVPAAPPTQVPARHNGGLTFASQTSVVLLDPTGGGARRYLVPGLVKAFAWSPDGSELAFVPALDCSIVLLNVTTNQRVRLDVCPHPSSNWYDSLHLIAWSPDGSRILFQNGKGLAAIGVDGTSERTIATDLAPDSWSPDGKRVSLTKPLGVREYVYVANADGSDPEAIAPGFLSAWSPDGTTIAFLRDPPRRHQTGAGDPNILQAWLMNPDGSNQRMIGKQRGCCIGATPSLAWSPDGKLLLLSGVRMQVIDTSTGASRIVHSPAYVYSMTPWQPVP